MPTYRIYYTDHRKQRGGADRPRETDLGETSRCREFSVQSDEEAIEEYKKFVAESRECSDRNIARDKNTHYRYTISIYTVYKLEKVIQEEKVITLCV